MWNSGVSEVCLEEANCWSHNKAIDSMNVSCHNTKLSPTWTSEVIREELVEQRQQISSWFPPWNLVLNWDLAEAWTQRVDPHWLTPASVSSPHTHTHTHTHIHMHTPTPPGEWANIALHPGCRCTLSHSVFPCSFYRFSALSTSQTEKKENSTT